MRDDQLAHENERTINAVGTGSMTNCSLVATSKRVCPASNILTGAARKLTTTLIPSIGTTLRKTVILPARPGTAAQPAQQSCRRERHNRKADERVSAVVSSRLTSVSSLWPMARVRVAARRPTDRKRNSGNIRSAFADRVHDKQRGGEADRDTLDQDERAQQQATQQQRAMF